MRENIITGELRMDAANIDFFDIRLFDLIDQPTRNGQEANSVGSAKGIQTRWCCAGRCDDEERGARHAYGRSVL